jgi:hypothetical protein
VLHAIDNLTKISNPKKRLGNLHMYIHLNTNVRVCARLLSCHVDRMPHFISELGTMRIDLDAYNVATCSSPLLEEMANIQICKDVH